MSLAHTAEALRLEARDRVRDLIRGSGLALKTAFEVVGRRLGGLPPGRVKQFYYDEHRSLSAAEMELIRSLHSRFAQLSEEQRAIERRMQEILAGHEDLDHRAPDGALSSPGGHVAARLPPARPAA